MGNVVHLADVSIGVAVQGCDSAQSKSAKLTQRKSGMSSSRTIQSTASAFLEMVASTTHGQGILVSPGIRRVCNGVPTNHHTARFLAFTCPAWKSLLQTQIF